jgi:hypothetical protein
MFLFLTLYWPALNPYEQIIELIDIVCKQAGRSSSSR